MKIKNSKLQINQTAQNMGVDIAALESRLPSKHKRSHKAILKVRGVNKSFKIGDREIPILKNIELTIYAGEFAIIYGPSGCGKSTLLHTMLGLEAPSSGTVSLREHEIYSMSSDERTNWRREKVGMVFQQANWIKAYNVWENVAYPLYLSGMPMDEAKVKAQEVLTEVGLSEWVDHRPTELSGGQQQRVALARALATDPWILIADEPTGNLDSLAGTELLELLVKLNREKHRTIIMVTHDMAFLPLANRRILIKDGMIVGDERDE
jgi:putative ABC transport system ATP-binding protein